MDSKFSISAALLVLTLAFAAEAIPPTKVFNVKAFGAIPDGITDSSKAFLYAWKEACAWEGGARVVIPAGTFLVGPAVFKGPCKGAIVFQVTGVVKAPGLDKFPSDGWIEFQYINGLMVTGGGTFDGQGAAAWPYNQCPKMQKCKMLPTSLRFSFVNDATIRKFTSLNSKHFHMNIFACKNVKLQALTISAPGDSPNTDGIHMGEVSGIKISRSVIGTGDDCISIGPGSSNVSVSNVVCGPGHGISIGSLGKYAADRDKDVVDLKVRNCTIKDTTNGLRIKTWQDSAVLSASRFTFEDVVMDNVYNPIIIDQEYCPFASCAAKSPSRVKISEVSFRNIRGSSASEVAVNLLCSKGVPCQNVRLENINLEYNGVGGPAKASCSSVKGISSGPQNPPSCL
ncbi:hypothetical protein ACLOJK_022372 [Asimina triloba]